MFPFQTALPIVGDMGTLLKVLFYPAVCRPLHLFLLQSIGHWTLEVWLIINRAKINKQKMLNLQLDLMHPKKFPFRCISARLLQTLKPDISKLFPSVRLCMDLKTDLTLCYLEEAYFSSIKLEDFRSIAFSIIRNTWVKKNTNEIL